MVVETPDQKPHGASGATGPYEVVLFFESLGKALPIVVIVGLIAVGAYYAIRELSDLQSKVIEAQKAQSEAEIKKAQAEAAAGSASARAKQEALEQYTKQLTDLNKTTADFSKQLQELVASQIKNMMDMEALRKHQEASTKEYQDQINKGLEAQRDKLASDVTAAQDKNTLLLEQYALAPYRTLRTQLMEAATKRILYGCSCV